MIIIILYCNRNYIIIIIILIWYIIRCTVQDTERFNLIENIEENKLHTKFDTSWSA